MQPCWVVVQWSDHGGITLRGVYEHEARARDLAASLNDPRVRVMATTYHRYSSVLAELQP